MSDLQTILLTALPVGSLHPHQNYWHIPCGGRGQHGCLAPPLPGHRKLPLPQIACTLARYLYLSLAQPPITTWT